MFSDERISTSSRDEGPILMRPNFKWLRQPPPITGSPCKGTQPPKGLLVTKGAKTVTARSLGTST